MRCAFTPLAEADLEAIGDYIARDNPRRALTFLRELRERCERRRDAARRAAAPRTRRRLRVVTFGRHLICCAERGDDVLIKRVIRGAKSLRSLFR